MNQVKRVAALLAAVAATLALAGCPSGSGGSDCPSSGASSSPSPCTDDGGGGGY